MVIYKCVLYLSQESEMLDDEMSTFCFACSTFPTDNYTLRGKKLHIILPYSKRYIKLIQLTKDLSLYNKRLQDTDTTCQL